MDEDDLLGGEGRQDQDLRRQLMRGNRDQGGGVRVGGGERSMEQGGPGHGFGRGRLEIGRQPVQQGGWQACSTGNRTQQQGDWPRNERRIEKAPMRDRGGGPSNEGNSSGRSSSEIKCFRCLEEGHHQSDCVKEPVCYKCKQKGHMAVDCNFNSKRLKMFRYGIPGQGFYAINIPEAKVKEGEATEEKLDQELKHLAREDWDFRVKRVDLQEFLVFFPDKSSLKTFSKLTCFEMSLYGFRGKLEKSNLDPEMSFMLHTVWIRIHKVPGIAREVELVKEIANLVSKPLVVDELSLIRDGPVRV